MGKLLIGIACILLFAAFTANSCGCGLAFLHFCLSLTDFLLALINCYLGGGAETIVSTLYVFLWHLYQLGVCLLAAAAAATSVVIDCLAAAIGW